MTDSRPDPHASDPNPSDLNLSYPNSSDPNSSDRNPWTWPLVQQRQHLEQCWLLECDIDPMILRARLLRHQGALPQASCVEQELLPLF